MTMQTYQHVLEVQQRLNEAIVLNLCLLPPVPL
jgi:hypothetical protein